MLSIKIKRQLRKAAEHELSRDEALGRISESPELARECGFDINVLHCHGCIKSCTLSGARCDFGRSLARALSFPE